jgi:hypothetical protein
MGLRVRYRRPGIELLQWGRCQLTVLSDPGSWVFRRGGCQYYATGRQGLELLPLGHVLSMIRFRLVLDPRQRHSAPPPLRNVRMIGCAVLDGIIDCLTDIVRNLPAMENTHRVHTGGAPPRAEGVNRMPVKSTHPCTLCATFFSAVHWGAAPRHG